MSERVSSSATTATRFARSPACPPAGVMRAMAPFTTDAIFVGSAEAGSLIERTRDASPGSVFDACSMSFIARSISRGEPSRSSEFESLSTATVTPSFTSSFAPPFPSACAAASTGATCANASARNASRAGSAGGQPDENARAGAVVESNGAALLCELPAGFGADFGASFPPSDSES